MKKSLGKVTVVYPHPVFIIGTYNPDEKPNMMAASWGGICCSKPPSIAISLREATYTYNNMFAHGAFTVNIPPVKHVHEADYSGTVTGEKVDKFVETGLTPIDSKIVHAPYIEEFPMSLICKVSASHKIGLHTMFIGEIMDVLADEAVLNEKGMPDIEKVDSFLYDSVGRAYHRFGDKIMDAWSNKYMPAKK